MDSELRLMIPGPTVVSEKVLEKLALPMMPHYGDEWSAFYFDIVAKAKQVFQTQSDLFILATTSSAAMEVALSHAVEPGETILICNNGFFGDRFAEIAECLGAKVVITRSDHGQAITEEQVRSALKEHPEIRALAVVHNESSTAVETELSGITKAAQEHDVLTIVDCVSSMGAVDVPTDELGIDFCLTGSQKCLAAPAGLALISVSGRAWERIRNRRQPIPSWYLNLNILARYRDEWADWHPQGPNSASVPLYLALDQALDEIIEEGLPGRFARHTRARDAFRAAMRAMGLELFVEDAVASRTLTAVRLPEAMDGAALRKNMQANHKILIAGGLGATKNTVIRVGHLAWTASAEHLIPTIDAIESGLRAMGTDVPPGAAAKAFRNKFP
ncbi:MAG: alanine--glyoxylate aminotransferase family protein [Planctomycetes bacterium]|nr:alanine--glyoxylate aminotransferase family protein [Planctomycetota bacterium]